jgi:hypothetical protein
LRFAQDNRAVLAASEPTLPENLNDRVNDFWEPLFAIANHAGGHWPKLAMDAALALSGEEADTEERSIELLGDMVAELDQYKHPAMTSKRMIAALSADPERPWATWNKNKDPITERQLGGLLRPFRKLGVRSETVHGYETGEPDDAKGFKRARFEEARERYLTRPHTRAAGNGALDPSGRPNLDEMGTTSDFGMRPDGDPDGCKKSEKSANDGAWDTRTDRKSKDGGEARSGSANGQDHLPVCAHCGAPATADAPVQVCAVDGEEFPLHRECKADWLKEP